MKKLIACFLLLAMMLALAACGSDKDDDGGSSFFGNYGNSGNSGNSGYASSSTAQDTAAGTGAYCKECGKSIKSTRSYCDPCLYGTCLICGKKLDWTKGELYCSSCGVDTAEGYGANCRECGKSIKSDRMYCDPCLYGTCLGCGTTLLWPMRELYCSNCD